MNDAYDDLQLEYQRAKGNVWIATIATAVLSIVYIYTSISSILLLRKLSIVQLAASDGADMAYIHSSVRLILLEVSEIDAIANIADYAFYVLFSMKFLLEYHTSAFFLPATTAPRKFSDRLSIQKMLRALHNPDGWQRDPNTPLGYSITLMIIITLCLFVFLRLLSATGGDVASPFAATWISIAHGFSAVTWITLSVIAYHRVIRAIPNLHVTSMAT